MAEFWITVSIEDRASDPPTLVASKAFLINFSSDDPQTWFANPLAWGAAMMQPQADLLVLETQEAIIAQRRIDLEASLAAPPVVEEPVVVEEPPAEPPPE